MLQGVKTGYKMSQAIKEVTRGNRGLEGVTEG